MTGEQMGAKSGISSRVKSDINSCSNSKHASDEAGFPERSITGGLILYAERKKPATESEFRAPAQGIYAYVVSQDMVKA